MNVVMGDDEFILYIRKQYPNCKTGNDDLGKAIWGKLKSLDPTNAKIEKSDAPCYWGNSGPFVAVNKLPKTAAQFSFDRACLPDLYDFLDQLGRQE